MRKSRLVAAWLALTFGLVGYAPVLHYGSDPRAWAWAALVWAIALGFAVLVIVIPPAHYRGTW